MPPKAPPAKRRPEKTVERVNLPHLPVPTQSTSMKRSAPDDGTLGSKSSPLVIDSDSGSSSDASVKEIERPSHQPKRCKLSKVKQEAAFDSNEESLVDEAPNLKGQHERVAIPMNASSIHPATNGKQASRKSTTAGIVSGITTPERARNLSRPHYGPKTNLSAAFRSVQKTRAKGQNALQSSNTAATVLSTPTLSLPVPSIATEPVKILPSLHSPLQQVDRFVSGDSLSGSAPRLRVPTPERNLTRLSLLEVNDIILALPRVHAEQEKRVAKVKAKKGRAQVPGTMETKTGDMIKAAQEKNTSDERDFGVKARDDDFDPDLELVDVQASDDRKDNSDADDEASDNGLIQGGNVNDVEEHGSDTTIQMINSGAKGQLNPRLFSCHNAPEPTRYSPIALSFAQPTSVPVRRIARTALPDNPSIPVIDLTQNTASVPQSRTSTSLKKGPQLPRPSTVATVTNLTALHSSSAAFPQANSGTAGSSNVTTNQTTTSDQRSQALACARESAFLRAFRSKWWPGGLSMRSTVAEVNAALPSDVVRFGFKEGVEKLRGLAGRGELVIWKGVKKGQETEEIWHLNEDEDDEKEDEDKEEEEQEGEEQEGEEQEEREKQSEEDKRNQEIEKKIERLINKKKRLEEKLEEIEVQIMKLRRKQRVKQQGSQGKAMQAQKERTQTEQDIQMQRQEQPQPQTQTQTGKPEPESQLTTAVKDTHATPRITPRMAPPVAQHRARASEKSASTPTKPKPTSMSFTPTSPLAKNKAVTTPDPKIKSTPGTPSTQNSAPSRSPYGKISSQRYHLFTNHLTSLIASRALFANKRREEPLFRCAGAVNMLILNGKKKGKGTAGSKDEGKFSLREVSAAFVYLAKKMKVVLKGEGVRLVEDAW